jgi:hypothetical protein
VRQNLPRIYKPTHTQNQFNWIYAYEGSRPIMVSTILMGEIYKDYSAFKTSTDTCRGLSWAFIRVYFKQERKGDIQWHILSIFISINGLFAISHTSLAVTFFYFAYKYLSQSLIQYRLQNIQSQKFFPFVSLNFINTAIHECWSRWPRGLRHKLSSFARTLVSWVRIPLEAWMSVCVYSTSVLSCVWVTAFLRSDPRLICPSDYV